MSVSNIVLVGVIAGLCTLYGGLVLRLTFVERVWKIPVLLMSCFVFTLVLLLYVLSPVLGLIAGARSTKIPSFMRPLSIVIGPFISVYMALKTAPKHYFEIIEVARFHGLVDEPTLNKEARKAMRIKRRHAATLRRQRYSQYEEKTSRTIPALPPPQNSNGSGFSYTPWTIVAKSASALINYVDNQTSELKHVAH